jgi:hypothetical protein
VSQLPDDKVLDRLMKLLEMSKRGTENEAEIAAQRAAELCAKYQLDVADVEAQLQAKGGKAKVPEFETIRIDGDDPKPKRVERWHGQLLGSIAEVMGCRAWMHGKGRYQIFLMIGPKGRVAAAKYLYAMLEKDVNRMSREAQRRHGEGSNAWRRSYAIGMVSKIYLRLKQGKAEAFKGATGGALVVVDATQKALDEEMAKMDLKAAKTKARKRPDATSWGYLDGDKVDLGSAGRAGLTEGQKKLT